MAEPDGRDAPQGGVGVAVAASVDAVSVLLLAAGRRQRRGAAQSGEGRLGPQPVTDSVLEEGREWQNRPLDTVDPVIFLDALVRKVRESGVVIKQGRAPRGRGRC